MVARKKAAPKAAAKKAAPKAAPKKAAPKAAPKSNKAAAKAPKSEARTRKYAVPGDVRKPREGSIIGAIYAAIKKRRNAATGDAILTAVADNAAVTKPKSGEQFSEGEVLSTIRWLVNEQRLEVVE